MKRIVLTAFIYFLSMLACNSQPQVATPPHTGQDSPSETATMTPTPLQFVMSTLTPTPYATDTPVVYDTPTATIAVTPTPVPTVVLSGQVNADRINLRRTPSTTAEVVTKVDASQVLTVIGRNADSSWWQVLSPTDNVTPAWIRADLITVSNPSNLSLPITDNVANTAPPANPGQSGSAPIYAPPQSSSLPANGGFAGPSSINPLTGQALSGGQANLRPVIICVNNDVAARPQYGLGRADVVYEYMMEGNAVTRYSAIFYGETADRIGPVRSARLINYSLGGLYDSATMCSGASDAVRYMLKHQSGYPYFDIDLDDPGTGIYSVSIGRDYRTRLQTSTSGYRAWVSKWNEERGARMRGFTFGNMASGGVSANTINIPYPRSSRVSYQYDPSTGRYLRILAGANHTDGGTGQVIAPENVFVQFVPHGLTDILEDSLGNRSIQINLFGSGRGILFRDGQAFEGTWTSSSGGDTPRLVNASGQEIPWKVGKTWVSVVDLNLAVTYQ